MSQSRTIITYLVDGNPQGVKTVEFSNRLIKGISMTRKDFSVALKSRPELGFSGIYFLLGEDELGNKIAYLGQATILGKRLNDHYKNTDKDFWNTAIAFTYKDGTLNESDINFLEKELILAATQANRYKIQNGNSGNNGLIQEYRKPDMEEFIEDLKILIANLGFNILHPLVSSYEIAEESNLYYIHGRGSNAKGMYTEEGFIVLKGSVGSGELVTSEIKRQGYAYKDRPILLSEGIIKEEGDKIIFLENHLFASPSRASCIVLGRASNGRTERKDNNGKTLDENERQ